MEDEKITETIRTQLTHRTLNLSRAEKEKSSLGREKRKWEPKCLIN